MKKFMMIPIVFVCLILAVQTQANASGSAMAVVYSDGVALAKFKSDNFSISQVESFTQQIKQLVNLYGYGSQLMVCGPSELGDPDALRSALQSYLDDFEVLFMEISKREAPVQAASKNISIDIWYDNMGFYVGSFGIQEFLTKYVQ